MKEFAEAGAYRGRPAGKKIIANTLGEYYIFSEQECKIQLLNQFINEENESWI